MRYVCNAIFCILANMNAYPTLKLKIPGPAARKYCTHEQVLVFLFNLILSYVKRNLAFLDILWESYYFERSS